MDKINNYNDLPELVFPNLKDTSEKGRVVYIKKAGFDPSSKSKYTITIYENNQLKVYKVKNYNVKEWIEFIVGQTLSGFKCLPSYAEIGIVDGRGFVELLNEWE